MIKYINLIVLLLIVSATAGFAQNTNQEIIEDFKPSVLNQPGKEYPKVNSQGYARFRIEGNKVWSAYVYARLLRLKK